MTELLEVLMCRDNLTESEAMEVIECLVQSVMDGEDPEDVLYEEGLEPDYLFDLLEYVEDYDRQF